MNKFWNFANNAESGETELYFEGPISDSTWLGDEITPALFRDELGKHPGNLTVWLSSPGGDVFAASQIYTMLKNHKGKITVKINALAASAASVVAMAGDETFISPSAYLMIHNPAMLCMGNRSEMEKSIAILDEIKEGIINAYSLKTHRTRAFISKLMDDETWMNAEKALQLGFVDGILYTETADSAPEIEENQQNTDSPDEEKYTAMQYSPKTVTDSFLARISATGTPIEQLEKRLNLLKY